VVRMQISKVKLHKSIVFTIIVLSVFIDLLNGYLNYYKSFPLPIGVVFRTIITLFGFFYLLVNPKLFIYKTYVGGVFLLWVFCNAFWTLNSQDIDLALELSLFAKILYPLIIIFYIKYVIDKGYVPFERVLKWMVLNGLICGLSILFSYITGIGFSTYGYGETGSSYGFGTTSFFKAQNDLTLSVLLSFCISLYFLFLTKKFLNLLKACFILIGLILIGTRAGLLGGFALIFFFIIHMLFLAKGYGPKKLLLKFTMFTLILAFATFSGIFAYNKIRENPYMIKKYAISALQSPREVLSDAANSYIDKTEKNTGYFLFGLGNKTYTSALPLASGVHKSNDENEKTAEKDFTDLIGGYGIIFALFVFALPLIVFIKLFKNWLSDTKDALKFSLFIAIALFLFHSIFAGHGIKNPQVGTLLSIVYIYGFVTGNRSKAEIQACDKVLKD